MKFDDNARQERWQMREEYRLQTMRERKDRKDKMAAYTESLPEPPKEE